MSKWKINASSLTPVPPAMRPQGQCEALRSPSLLVRMMAWTRENGWVQGSKRSMIHIHSFTWKILLVLHVEPGGGDLGR